MRVVARCDKGLVFVMWIVMTAAGIMPVLLATVNQVLRYFLA
jgi:hypothetical protein